jgi:hypothetical protein
MPLIAETLLLCALSFAVAFGLATLLFRRRRLRQQRDGFLGD